MVGWRKRDDSESRNSELDDRFVMGEERRRKSQIWGLCVQLEQLADGETLRKMKDPYKKIREMQVKQGAEKDRRPEDQKLMA